MFVLITYEVHINQEECRSDVMDFASDFLENTAEMTETDFMKNTLISYFFWQFFSFHKTRRILTWFLSLIIYKICELSNSTITLEEKRL